MDLLKLIESRFEVLAVCIWGGSWTLASTSRVPIVAPTEPSVTGWEKVVNFLLWVIGSIGESWRLGCDYLGYLLVVSWLSVSQFSGGWGRRH